MDVYTDCLSNLLPEVLTEDVANNLKLTPARRLNAAMRDLRLYPQVLTNFVRNEDAGICKNFSFSNWDHHFQEEVNDALRKIPLEQFANRSYSSQKLISLGWSVIVAYSVDKSKNCSFLSLVVDKLLREKPTKESAMFVQKLWGRADDLDLPVSLFENIVTVMPYYLENLICDLVHSSLNEPDETCKYTIKDILQKDGAESWMKMCSKSPRIFQISASIINMLLLLSGEKAIKCLAFIEIFISVIQNNVDLGQNCANKSLVSLYPVHLQSLVILLTINPDSLSLTEMEKVQIVKKVTEQLIDGLVTNRAVYLCLLSHFPYWIKHVPSNFVTFPITL